MKNLLNKLTDADYPVSRTHILVGDAVIVEDPRISEYNPDSSIPVILKGFCLYKKPSIFGSVLPPLISHAIVKLVSLDNKDITIAVPLSTVRVASAIERHLGFKAKQPTKLETVLSNIKRKALDVLNMDNGVYLLSVVENRGKLPTNPKGAKVSSYSDTLHITQPKFKLEEDVKVKNTKPLLDWDATEDTINNVTTQVSIVGSKDEPKVEDTPYVIPKTQDLGKTFRESAQPQAVENPTSVFIPNTPEQNIAAALKAIAALNEQEGLDDLEGSAGRVQVDDKRMINCRADLNQLVPFRYEFAWQAYLKATEHHWMHTEVVMTKDVDDWKTATPEETKAIMSALYSLELLSTFRNNDPCLTLYKHITNPEARQYILRQRFEVTVLGNYVHSVMDEFNYQFPVTEQTNPKTGKVIKQCDWYSLNDANYSSFFKQEQVRARQIIRRNIETFVGDIQFVPTSSLEDRQGIVERILYHYLSFGFIFTFASFIQVISIAKSKSEYFTGLHQGFTLMLRDTALQTSFGMLVLKQIFEENPDILTREFVLKLTGNIRSHVEAETEYMDWWANANLENAKLADQIQTLKYMVNRMTKDIGLGKVFEEVDETPSIDWYVSMYDRFIPNLHSGGATVLSSGGTGSGGTLTGWDDV